MAFARFGKSSVPMENFHWADNDYAPRGTAETVIKPSLTFKIDSIGNISAYTPEEIQFKDDGNWRPVCPFFELHGEFSDGSSGPIGLEELEGAGLSLGDIRWTVQVANRKAYHYTLNRDDLVEATVQVSGEDHFYHALEGVCSDEAKQPLVPKGASVALGGVQVVRPNPDYPELRLRITPPKGLIYAPTNTDERDLGVLIKPNEDEDEFLRQLVTILNPKAPWPNWVPPKNDSRTNPGGLYAQEPTNRDDNLGNSLGFLDDSGDGTITVEVRQKNGKKSNLSACARFTYCPQDFQPDRRPFVSVADGLSDLVKREEVSEPGFMNGLGWLETEAEIADLMQRVRETMENSNLDHQNLRSKLGNDSILDLYDETARDIYPFEPEPPRPGHPLPLTTKGREMHARFLSYEVFKQRLAQRPEIFENIIRKPTDLPDFYDNKMPALMRGSDSYPMTISQRQFNMMKEWLGRIEQGKAPAKKSAESSAAATPKAAAKSRKKASRKKRK